MRQGVAGIGSQEALPPAARGSAAGILLDRGWGKPAQPHAGEDGNIPNTLIGRANEMIE